MSKNKNIETTTAFYGQLFHCSKYVVLFIFMAFVVQLYIKLIFPDAIIEAVLIVLTVLKLILIVRLTFTQLTKIIGKSHLLSHVLMLFGFLIALIIISFTIDYTALYLIDSKHFKITGSSKLEGLSLFFEMSYFSTITFSSVGYGDIIPTSIIAKVTVMLEVLQQFFVLVFGIANVNKIRINN